MKAKLAHDKLDLLLDDDSGNGALGELLLKPIKEEMTEEEYAAAEAEHADMTTLLMQGNLSLVNSMMSDLSMMLDTSDESWLTRLQNSAGIDTSVLLLGAGIGSFIHSSALQKAAVEARVLAVEARRLNGIVSTQEAKAADAFYQYLLKEKVSVFEGFNVISKNSSSFEPEKVLSIYRKARQNAAANKEINLYGFEKGEYSELDFDHVFRRNGKEYLDNAASDADYKKALDSYEEALQNAADFKADEKIRQADELTGNFLP